MNDDSIYCKDCGFQFVEEESNYKRKPCPHCKSTCREFHGSLNERVKAYDSWRGQSKSSQYTGKRKLRWDSFSGWKKSHLLGKMIRKTRTIDKDKNLYQETIIDPDTNEVIHHCKEPLDKHIGHGYAKSKKL